MKQSEFLSALERELKGLSLEKRESILVDYREHFREGAERGMSEDALAQKLGDPRALGKQHFLQSASEEKFRTLTLSNAFRAMAMVVGLLFINISFLSVIWFVLLGFLVSAWGLCVVPWALAFVAAVLGLGGVLMASAAASWGFLLLALGCASIGFLGLAICWILTKFFLQGTWGYLKLNMRTVQKVL